MTALVKRHGSPGSTLRRREPERIAAFGYAVPPVAPMIGDIARAAARASGFSLTQFVSADRHRAVTFPRQCAMWIAFHATVRSLPEIGRRLGRDHTTVLHAIAVTDTRLAEGSREAMATVSAILQELAAMPSWFEATPAPIVEPDPQPARGASNRAQHEPWGLKRTHGVAGFETQAEERQWFAENDAVFRAGMAALLGGAGR